MLSPQVTKMLGWGIVHARRRKAFFFYHCTPMHEAKERTIIEI